ncbi:MAG: MipA/OmpV family protein [Colwelliaceae bacterium]|jgi:outer membrane scaffolding protein for murein synthesis (MipA/OmpV family)|nr:MipA/OmpV family protein [Colwelliaceae bacterium]
MRKLLAFVLWAICCSALATSKSDSKESVTLDKNFPVQWGLDALNIPKYLHDNSAESLGLILPHQNSTDNLNTTFTSENYKINNVATSNNYRFSTVQGSFMNSNKTGINIMYSYGRFSAETGMLSNSKNILSSGKIYLQGAYSLFENQNLNISVTAKVEALDESNVNSYYGDKKLAVNNSIFEEHQATNTTLGIISTYSINKQWKVLGIISSTTLDNKIENSPLIDDSNLHMALIGTSYAF